MKHKILIIDDEPSIRLLLENFLSKTYEVIVKSDGMEALEWLEGNLPDLIICDIQMKNLDGYQFLEKLRQRGFTKHTPVIMLSGVESSKERIKCYQLGAQDFLSKPFNPEELGELIKKNLFPIHYAIKW
jgi:DNA-binding response OmpR family regulator